MLVYHSCYYFNHFNKLVTTGELDEVEARNEEFPMTLGFLELMKVLTENPVPACNGCWLQGTCFDPYLNFLRDSIFLKFNTRALQESCGKGKKYVCSCNSAS